jgi:uncharacterized protein (DUF952 family)
MNTKSPSSGLIYKITTAAEWAAAGPELVPWAAIDRADGFIHLSAAHQVRETARKHFAGQADLVLLTVDVSQIPEGGLRWEASRGGDLFPHVYGDIPGSAVTSVDPLRDSGASWTVTR